MITLIRPYWPIADPCLNWLLLPALIWIALAWMARTKA